MEIYPYIYYIFILRRLYNSAHAILALELERKILYFSWIGHIPDILFQIQNFSQVTCCIGREFFTSAKVNYCNLGSTAWTVAMP